MPGRAHQRWPARETSEIEKKRKKNVPPRDVLSRRGREVLIFEKIPVPSRLVWSTRTKKAGNDLIVGGGGGRLGGERVQ